MRSARTGRRRLSWKGAAKVAVPVISLSLFAAACSGQNGTTAAPSGASASQARTAAVVLSTERSALSDLKVNLAAPSDFCSTIVPQFGGSMVPRTVGNKSVNIPDFTVPSTYPVDHTATALKQVRQSSRLWGDAVNTALPYEGDGKNRQYTMQAVEASICSQPDYAVAMIRGLAYGTVGGITIARLNSWMTKGSPSPLQTEKWANHCYTGNPETQIHCATVMSNTAYLLTKFRSFGVHKDTADWYYHLTNGLVVGSIPPIQFVAGKYTGYFIEFRYTTKTGGCFLDYGVNVGRKTLNGGDQRLVGFNCHQPQSPGPVASATPTGTKTQPVSSPPTSSSPSPSKTPQPRPSTSSPAPPSSPPPTTSTPTPPPSTTPPSTPTPTPTPSKSHCGCSQTPTPTPTPSKSHCGCTSTPTPTPSETHCGCTSTPSDTPSATPSDSYTSPPATDTPSDTPTPVCTCQQTVQQVETQASSLGLILWSYGAEPPPDSVRNAGLAA